MKRKRLIVSVGILLALAAASGFIVSAVTVRKIETALAEPLQLGVLTLVPGNRIDSHVGYFNSRVTIQDSVIEFGPSRFNIPEITVCLDREQLVIEAAEAQGNVEPLDSARVTGSGIRLVAPYQGSPDRPSEMKARMTIDSMAIEEHEQHVRLAHISLDILRSRHKFWDQLVLEIAELKGDGKQVSALVSGGKFVQTQVPGPNGRLAVTSKIHLGDIQIKDPEEQAQFSAGPQDLAIQGAIDGNEGTIFLQTLRELAPDENTPDRYEAALNQYMEKYHPTVEAVAYQGGNFAMNSKDATLACADFRVDSHYRHPGELAESQLESVLTKLSVAANGSRTEIGKMSLTSTARIHSDRQNRFIQLVSHYQAHALTEILDAAFGLFESYQVDNRWAISDLSYTGSGQQQPIRVEKGSLDVTIAFDQGIGNLSITPKLTCSQLDALPEVAALQLGIDSFAAGLGIALNRINLQAFQPLSRNLVASKPQAGMEAADTAARAFAASKPQAQITFDLSGRDGPALAVSLQYEIEQALPKDFSLAPVFQGTAPLEQVIGQALGKASALRLTLTIDHYPKLLALLDRLQGPGTGAQFLQQTAAFVKVEGERIHGELLIRDRKALLNGEPNPLVQFFVDQFLSGTP